MSWLLRLAAAWQITREGPLMELDETPSVASGPSWQSRRGFEDMEEANAPTQDSSHILTIRLLRAVNGSFDTYVDLQSLPTDPREYLTLFKQNQVPPSLWYKLAVRICSGSAAEMCDNP